MVFGASVTYGSGDERGGWVGRLKEYVDKKYADAEDGYFVYNLGVPGDTSADLLARFSNEAAARIEPGSGAYIFISIGLNDSAFLKSKGGSYVRIDEFEDNLKKLVSLAEAYSKNIFFIGLTPVDDSKTNPVPWAADISYKDEEAAKYEKAARRIFEEKGYGYIDILKDWQPSRLAYLADGLHPDGRGHESIFNAVKEYLESRKII